jgi:hypothetical protein
MPKDNEATYVSYIVLTNCHQKAEIAALKELTKDGLHRNMFSYSVISEKKLIRG